MWIYWNIGSVFNPNVWVHTGYKIGDVSPPARSTKLKRIYGSKMSKTANLDTISIHIPMYYVYGWWLLPRGGGQLSRGGEYPLAPP